MPIYWQVHCTYCIHFCIVFFFFAVNCKLVKYCDFYVVHFLCVAANSDFIQLQHNHCYCLFDEDIFLFLFFVLFFGQKTQIFIFF